MGSKGKTFTLFLVLVVTAGLAVSPLAVLPASAQNMLVATIRNIGAGGNAIVITPNGAYAYVANSNRNTSSLISTSTNSIIANVTVGATQNGIAITPDGSLVYVTCRDSNFVSVINTTSNTVIATITGFSLPYGVAVTPDGSHVYVSNTGNDSVAVLSTATNRITAIVKGGSAPMGIAITPDGSYVYITNYSSDTVSIIKTTTNTVVDTVTLGNHPVNVAITPNDQYAYVINALPPFYVTIIKTATHEVTALITGNFSSPQCVAFAPNGAYAYITSATKGGGPPYAIAYMGWVSVVDTTTNKIVTTIDNDNFYFLRAVAITPNGEYAYVVASDDVFAISTLSPIATPSVPELPYLIVMPLLLLIFYFIVVLRHRKTTNLNK